MTRHKRVDPGINTREGKQTGGRPQFSPRCLTVLVVSKSLTISVTAAVSAPAASAVPTPATATTATTAGTLFARPGDVDVQGTSAQFLPVQGVDGFLRLFRGAHRHEGKAARTPGVAVGNEVGLDDSAVSGKGVLQVVFGDFEVEVPDE